MILRRTFLTAGLSLCEAGLALLAACGQRSSSATPAASVGAPTKQYRIGFLIPSPPGSAPAASLPPGAFRRTLRELGYIEDETVTYEVRAGTIAQFDRFAAELVQAGVDLIFVTNEFTTRAAMQATITLPILFIIENDAVAAGLVESYARPGKNLTGLAVHDAPLWGKRLQLLQQASGSVMRISVLWSQSVSGAAQASRELMVAAQALEVQLQWLDVRGQDDIARAFAAAVGARAEALLLFQHTVINSNLRQIVDLALFHRLPTMYGSRGYVAEGGLMAYGPDDDELYRRAAVYAGKLLSGTKPSDLPVEQATKFQFAINLKTAQAIGLAIPSSVLAQATEVIQ